MSTSGSTPDKDGVTTTKDSSPITGFDLHDFERDVLLALAAEGEPTYGLAIKERLEVWHDKAINHGRLYPNLDSLVEYGLVSKGEIDGRTNSYELTDEGEALIDRWAMVWAEVAPGVGN